MTDHLALLKKLTTESRLELMRIDSEHAKLRAWMVKKYGEVAVKRFEASVKDGDGIKMVIRKNGHQLLERTIEDVASGKSF